LSIFKVALVVKAPASGNVELETFRLILCPAAPSNTTRPILLAVLTVAVRLGPPIAILPVNSTSVAAYGDGGIKKSSALVAFPNAVATDIRPDPVPVGTVATRDAPVEALTVERPLLNSTLFFQGVGLKFVPVIVTDVPGVPIAGVNPVIVGALVGPTVKTSALVAEPDGAVTPITPVLAPIGTVVTSFVALDEVTFAATPLNVTAFSLGVALNPVP